MAIKPRLAYLLRDPNTDAIVVPDLYHRHTGTWGVNAPITGYPGTSTMGSWGLSLPGPNTKVHWQHRDQYDAILAAAQKGIGLKVEGYLGRAGSGPTSLGGFGGQPVVSGVITKMDLPMDGPWQLGGQDTLFWLQQSQLFAGEQISLSNQAGFIIQSLSGTKEQLWGDNFANWSGTSAPGSPASTDYALTGPAWSSAPTDPMWGLSALKATGNGAIAVTGTSWSDTQFSASSVTAHGVVVAGSDTTFAGDAGILIMADATGANGYLFELIIKQTGAGTGLYNADVRIGLLNAGVYTQLAIASNVFTNVPTTFPFELTALRVPTATGADRSTTSANLRVLLNGKDPNCQVTVGTGVGGRVGLRFGFAAGGSPAMYVNALKFASRENQYHGWFGTGWGTNRFQVSWTGGFALSTGTSVIAGQGQTHLDVMLAMAAYDGGQVRKDPGIGAKADVLHYDTVTPGADLSGSVVFEEGRNVIASGTKLATAAELYASDVRANVVPGSDTGGSVTWGRIGVPGDMVLEDTVSDVGMVGFAPLIQYARLIQARKVAPLQAVQVEVVRDADMLRWNNGLGPRELDFVMLHLPTFGIRYQKAQIVGYVLDETKGSIVYYVTQFPEATLARHALQRVLRTIDFLGTTYAAR